MAESTSRTDAPQPLDKGKVALFIVLVLIAMACLVFMIWTLFFARPRTDPSIEKSRHSSALRALPVPSPHAHCVQG